MTVVLGVDGCPGGWIGALVSSSGEVTWHSLSNANQILAIGADATGLDIPIGLPDHGPRACDTAARRRLGKRRSSVFPAPIRGALTAATHIEASALSRRAGGRGMSVQTWLLVPKIAAVDAVLTPQLQSRVVEVHPELSFATLAGHPLPPKRTPQGRSARLGALRTWLSDPCAALRSAPAPARFDDALDALAAAWSAARWSRSEAIIVPEADPPRDSRGLRMQIVV